MTFKKGDAKPASSGKKKGTPNLKTALLKDMILNALDKAGGEEYLIKQARAEPVAFLGLIGKILPKEIEANLNTKGEIQIIVNKNYHKKTGE